MRCAGSCLPSRCWHAHPKDSGQATGHVVLSKSDQAVWAQDATTGLGQADLRAPKQHRQSSCKPGFGSGTKQRKTRVLELSRRTTPSEAPFTCTTYMPEWTAVMDSHVFSVHLPSCCPGAHLRCSQMQACTLPGPPCKTSRHAYHVSRAHCPPRPCSPESCQGAHPVPTGACVLSAFLSVKVCYSFYVEFSMSPDGATDGHGHPRWPFPA